ncbi:MAG TPA: vanadium-dependent haloperoxidase [Gemmatimonadales bacterium]|nr:vanadium-dependent haloperoxidase [Gemmatimonadales bacterium]
MTATACAMMLALSACGDQATKTVEADPEVEGVATLEADEIAAHRSGQASSTVRWNRQSTVLFRSRLIPGTPAPNFGRINAYLGLAQYRAVLAAREARHGRHEGRRPSLAGAAAGASVLVLKQFYPLDAAVIDAELAAQSAELEGRPHRAAAFEAGEALGREVAAAVLAEAATDNFGVAPLPPQPTGPGSWVSSGAPTVTGGFGARPFFLSSGDEINSPPPPAFGSAEFLAALAEVRALSDARTPEQVAITAKWVPFSSVPFTDLAADLVDRHYRGERAAAKIFAYANIAAYDAIIGCFHTKFTYWFIRPTQADPGITLATGLPNHPSYPSGHSCQSGAWQGVLRDAFPSERRLINATAAEASFSRVVGGLHYTFDGDEGLALGRRAAKLALQRGIE